MLFHQDLDAHEELQRLNAVRLQPEHADPLDLRTELERELRQRTLELEFLASAREEIARRASEAPAGLEDFMAWFERLRDTGPGQHDPLFDWLATEATLDQFRWFLRQEVAGEAGFDDLVALTQLKMPTRVKLELARNYWDEMGRGTESAMHGPMLHRLDVALELDHSIPPVPEALALANLLAGLAFNRAYAFHSVGALGVVELTAPDRARLVNIGLKRLGVAAGIRQYYALHATLDVKHPDTWNQEVSPPPVRTGPALPFPIPGGPTPERCERGGIR